MLLWSRLMNVRGEEFSQWSAKKTVWVAQRAFLTFARDWKLRAALRCQWLWFAVASLESPTMLTNFLFPFEELLIAAVAVERRLSDQATMRQLCMFCEMFFFIIIILFLRWRVDVKKISSYLCLGWGLNLACPYILTFCCCCLATSLLSIGGGKKLFLEPCRCSGGGVGSQSWLCDACGSMSMSCSRPGDNWLE